MILLNQQSDFLQVSDPEFLMMYIPVLVWILLLVVFFIFMLRRYTFRHWKGQTNPYKNETLGIPRGVIRATLSISLLFFVLLFEVFSLAFESLEARTESFFTAFELMIAFYFGGKVMHHLSSTDKTKNRDVANAVKENRKQIKEPEEDQAVG